MKITQAFTFEAAHRLTGVPASHKCSNMHGHSYRVELELEGPIDPFTGFVIDFFEVEAAFAPLHAKLDHHILNNTIENPTAENIAIWIWDQIIATLPQLVAVKVFETPNCWATYSEERVA